MKRLTAILTALLLLLLLVLALPTSALAQKRDKKVRETSDDGAPTSRSSSKRRATRTLWLPRSPRTATRWSASTV